MKNVVTRTLSGIIYIGVMVGAILAGGAWLCVLLGLLSLLGIHEYICITRTVKPHRLLNLIDVAIGVLFTLAVTLFFSTQGQGHYTVLLIISMALLLVRMAGQIYTHTPDSTGEIARAVFAQVYVAVPLACIPVLYYLYGSPQIVLAMLIFIWVNDTGAFCVGTLFGKHRLFERISPKKSWEGFWGGMAFCVLAAVTMRYFFADSFEGLSYGTLIRLGILISIAATLGDLFESMIKRNVGVKDSGNLIPGHGGILDRIDSLLFVAPATLLYFAII